MAIKARKRLGALLAVPALTAVAIQPAWGQEAQGDADEPITIVGARSSYAPAHSSTAMKTDTLLRDTPQSATVITRDLIEDQSMRSMGDVLRYTPGASMGQGEGHRDAPTLRGNASTADFFVDGVRDDVQYFRDLYNAERIEVLKGPNAMIFGRGGGGGVINRVTKEPDWRPRRELTVVADEYDQRRIAADVSGGASETVALRFNGVYERADSYRDFVNLERFGLNPSAALALGDASRLTLGYEYFSDDRTVDRGVPSQNGRPYDGGRSLFFGNPLESYTTAEAHLGHATLEHEFSPSLRLRNHTLFGDYDKYYQNVHANSPVDAGGDVRLQAYFSGTDRQNLFNQTDLVWETATGALEHAILVGLELGRQETNNTRARNNNETAGIVNIAAPTTFAPAQFLAELQNDDHVNVDVGALYLQDQIVLSEHVQVVAGVRFERFALDFDDRRAADADFSRTDDLVSPRLGLIYKPAEPISLYASYGVSYLPQSGDQFASLTATSAALEPEEFENIELGLKWDIRPALSLTAAIYRLDRTNTTAIDPVTSQTVLTGAQRSEGVELGLSGALTERWEIIAGYSYQDAEITRTTTAAPAGRIIPLIPEHAFSLWNHYRLSPMWSVGLGVTHQSDMFASISNAVTLPSFTRADAALYFTLNEHVEAQLNIENLFDETYWGTAHNDNNITPGGPRAARLTLKTRF